MPVISRIWARSALISAGLQSQQETGTRATGQRNWPTHPAVPPGTDDQNSTPARELEPPQPLLRSLDGGQHPCAKIGANDAVAAGRGQGVETGYRRNEAALGGVVASGWLIMVRTMSGRPSDHRTAILERGEGRVQASCSCGWRSAIFGADRRLGAMDALQQAADAVDLHGWDASLP